MKSVFLSLTMLISMSLAAVPAYAGALEEICRECGRTPSPCSETMREFCKLLGNTPATEPPAEPPGPGGPCCPSCYCFFENGVLYVIPLGDLDVGDRYFDERSATPWQTFRLPQLDHPSFGVPGQGLE